MKRLVLLAFMLGLGIPVSGQQRRDVDIQRGPADRDTLTWPERDKPNVTGVAAHVLMGLNTEKFNKFFVDLTSLPTTPKPPAGSQ